MHPPPKKKMAQHKRISIRRMLMVVALEWAKNKGRTNPLPVAIALILKLATLHVLLRRRLAIKIFLALRSFLALSLPLLCFIMTVKWRSRDRRSDASHWPVSAGRRHQQFAAFFSLPWNENCGRDSAGFPPEMRIRWNEPVSYFMADVSRPDRRLEQHLLRL